MAEGFGRNILSTAVAERPKDGSEKPKIKLSRIPQLCRSRIEEIKQSLFKDGLDEEISGSRVLKELTMLEQCFKLDCLKKDFARNFTGLAAGMEGVDKKVYSELLILLCEYLEIRQTRDLTFHAFSQAIECKMTECSGYEYVRFAEDFKKFLSSVKEKPFSLYPTLSNPQALMNAIDWYIEMFEAVIVYYKTALDVIKREDITHFKGSQIKGEQRFYEICALFTLEDTHDAISYIVEEIESNSCNNKKKRKSLEILLAYCLNEVSFIEHILGSANMEDKVVKDSKKLRSQLYAKLQYNIGDNPAMSLYISQFYPDVEMSSSVRYKYRSLQNPESKPINVIANGLVLLHSSQQPQNNSANQGFSLQKTLAQLGFTSDKSEESSPGDPYVVNVPPEQDPQQAVIERLEQDRLNQPKETIERITNHPLIFSEIAIKEIESNHQLLKAFAQSLLDIEILVNIYRESEIKGNLQEFLNTHSTEGLGLQTITSMRNRHFKKYIGCVRVELGRKYRGIFEVSGEVPNQIITFKYVGNHY